MPVNRVGMSVDIKDISMGEAEVKGSVCVLESKGERGIS